jgi:pimeloyl-ACP methyl ester carboxylesterase
MSPYVVSLETGADVRIRNERAPHAVVLVNGGTARAEPGTWSATSELLARELAPGAPDVAFLEVRYRVKTWHEIESCAADTRAALDLAVSRGAGPVLLIGFSMGGAVSAMVAGHGAVAAVLGLAPWFPPQLSLDALRGKRLDVVHGAWDRHLPGIPGVTPGSSRAGFDRAVALGAFGTYMLIPRGLHGCALRRPSGRLARLPRWRAWVDATRTAVDRYRAA